MRETIKEQKMEIYKQIEEILNLTRKSYNRVLTDEEKEMLDTEVLGYLLSLYQHGTVDHIKLEKLIYSCVFVADKENEKMDLDKAKSLVKMLLFYDNAIVYAKELIPLLNSIKDFMYETIN